MKNDDKLNRINEALNYFTEKGEIPTISNLVKQMNMTTQNFYSTLNNYVEYVNNCIKTIRFNQLADKVKSINKDYTLIEINKKPNNAYRLLLQCSNPNHEPFYALIGKFRCPECHKLDVQAKGLAKANEVAKAKGGVCLSTEYENQLSKLTFKCANPDHPAWTTTFLNVLYDKSWCKCCSDEARKLRKKTKKAKV